MFELKVVNNSSLLNPTLLRFPSWRACLQRTQLLPLFFVSLIFVDSARALDPSRSHQNLTPLTQYYPDELNNLTIEQAMNRPADSWNMSSTTNFSFGFTDAAYWLHTTLNNSSRAEQQLLLEIGRARFEEIDVYVSIDGQRTHMAGGSLRAFEDREYKHRSHLFPVNLATDQTADIFIRVKNSGSLWFPLMLWHKDKFFDADKNSMIIFGAYFGIWLLIIIFNAILYAVIPTRAVASFVAFVFTYGLYQLISLGFGTSLIWGRFPLLLDATSIVAISSATLSMMFFCSQVLDLNNSNKTGLRILQLFSYPVLLVVLAYPLLGYAGVIQPLTAIVGANAVIVIVLGLLSTIKGSRLGLYATIAWTPLLLGIIATVSVRFQFLPLNFVTHNAAPAGFILMMFSLSFVAAAEYRRRSREQPGATSFSVGNASVEDQNNSSEELEHMVHNRTHELEEALEELSQANETLREINIMDAVTGIKNRHYFDTAFENEWKRASREKYPLSLLLLDIDHFKLVNDKLGHLAGDECLYEIAATISAALKRPADIVARYGGEEFVAVLPYIENENAMKFANRIRSRVEAANYIVDGREVNVTVSIGVCTVTPSDDDEMKDMISAADIALYEAKNNGRNQVRNAGQLTVHEGNVAS
jgi:two-component system, sensor histidine kinase LadS